MIRKALLALLKRLRLPGQLYVTGRYIALDDSTVFPPRNGHLLHVAPHVSLHDAFFNVWDDITIEEGVALGHQVMFLTGRHSVNEHGVDSTAESRGPIRVCRGAWIGSRAIILGGVTVGDGSVVGAGSVVTRSVPPGEFWAGNPARLIRPVRKSDARTDQR